MNAGRRHPVRQLVRFRADWLIFWALLLVLSVVG